MARARLLTWDKFRKRWKKKFRGVQHYFPFGDSKTDETGYKMALEAWDDLKTTLDNRHVEDTERAIHLRRLIADYSIPIENEHDLQSPNLPFRIRIYAEIDHLEKNTQKAKPLSLDQLRIHVNPLWGTDEETKGLWLRRVPKLAEPWKPVPASARSVGSMIKTFLKTFLAKSEAGQLRPSYVQTVEAHLAIIETFLGSETPVAQIGTQTFIAFHSGLLQKIGKKDITPEYAETLMAVLRRFVKWLYASEVIDNLPRIIVAESRDLAFNVRPKKIKTFDADEINPFLDSASERTQLYILLALNCGMNQSDISALRPSEVDFVKGRITRRRTKTGDHENVPTVSYKLWPKTLDLLKKHRGTSPEYVLTNAKGGPLRSWGIKPNGKTGNLDNIRSAYERLLQKMKIKKSDRRTFKVFRKSAASELAKHKVYGQFAQFFLGHSPKTIADKHYVRPSDELFDEAINWLGEQYGTN